MAVSLPWAEILRHVSGLKTRIDFFETRLNFYSVSRHTEISDHIDASEPYQVNFLSIEKNGVGRTLVDLDWENVVMFVAACFQKIDPRNVM